MKLYADFSSPNISDNMNRINGACAEIRPMHGRGKLLGSAFTVRTRPGDNLIVHKALDMLQPGDALVVDAGGDTTNAIFGEIMTRISYQERCDRHRRGRCYQRRRHFLRDGIPLLREGGDPPRPL